MAVCALLALEAMAASDATFQGRSYRLAWPKSGEPRGVLVFLHGLSPKPFREEADAISTLSKIANERGIAVVLPRARKLCSSGKQRCWELKNADAELAYVDALVEHVEAQHNAQFTERHIVGFSHGGFLLSAAVEHGLLDEYARVGIVGGGPVGNAPKQKPQRAPPLFLEVGSDDKTQWVSMHELFQRMSSVPSELYFREVAGGHAIDGPRMTSFMRWFWASAPAPQLSKPVSSDLKSEETPRAPDPVSSPVR